MAGRKKNPNRNWKMYPFSLDTKVIKAFKKICKERILQPNLEIEKYMKSVVDDYERERKETEE